MKYKITFEFYSLLMYLSPISSSQFLTDNRNVQIIKFKRPMGVTRLLRLFYLQSAVEN